MGSPSPSLRARELKAFRTFKWGVETTIEKCVLDASMACNAFRKAGRTQLMAALNNDRRPPAVPYIASMSNKIKNTTLWIRPGNRGSQLTYHFVIDEISLISGHIRFGDFTKDQAFRTENR
jgi:hypothetical protein